MTETRHDTITVAAIAALAFICADVSHEALGHGGAAWPAAIGCLQQQARQ